jgi:exosortase
VNDVVRSRSIGALPAALAATGLAGLLAVLYGSTLKGLALEWASSPDSSYGALLAAVAVIIGWNRRRAVAAAIARHSNSSGGLVLLMLGLVAYLVGRFGADVFVTRVSLIVMVAGLTWYLAGAAAARILAVPIFFLLIAIPLPALVVNTITLPMQLVASRISENLLILSGVPVFRDGNVLELRSTTLEVAQACSGLRSLISLTAVACLVAWAAERSWLRRAVIVVAAVPIAVALNGLRVAATGLACEAWGPQMAKGTWHEMTGWITFGAAIATLLLFQRLLPARRNDVVYDTGAEWAPS